MARGELLRTFRKSTQVFDGERGLGLEPAVVMRRRERHLLPAGNLA